MRSGGLLEPMRPGRGSDHSLHSGYSSYRTSWHGKGLVWYNIKMQVQKTVCLRNVPQMYGGRLFWAAVNVIFLKLGAVSDSFARMAVFFAAALIDNSAVFRISYESEYWWKLQV
jgi:hypothetical protein